MQNGEKDIRILGDFGDILEQYEMRLQQVEDMVQLTPIGSDNSKHTSFDQIMVALGKLEKEMIFMNYAVRRIETAQQEHTTDIVILKEKVGLNRLSMI